MLGLIGVLASSLLAIVLVFVIMLMSYLKSMLYIDGEDYRLEVTSQYLYPVDKFAVDKVIVDEIIGNFVDKTNSPSVYIDTFCTYGASIDKYVAERYTAFNFIFLYDYKKGHGIHPNAVTTSKSYLDRESNKCYLMLSKEPKEPKEQKEPKEENEQE